MEEYTALRNLFPKNAIERARTTNPDGTMCLDVLWKGKVIGSRVREKDGSLSSECQLDQGGRRHGCERWWISGHLISEERWRAGRQHGIARQWAFDGRLLGSYRMNNGTGVDLWRNEEGRLQEEYHLRHGFRQGFERWWTGDDQAVREERHWQHSRLHGIEREWDETGQLKKGYPRFHVKGNRVTKAAYLAACVSNRTLPQFDEADNTPQRGLPREYTRQVKRPRRKG